MRRHGWAYKVFKDLETNHDTQIRFHKWAIAFWGVFFVVFSVMVFVWPAAWTSIGVYIVFAVSIYANADTDYDALSAAQAAKHSQDLLDRDP